MVVVVIVAMGLLITVLAVGVVKLRAVVARDLAEDEADAEAEVGWEGAPNITLNPLEVSYEQTAQLRITHDESPPTTFKQNNSQISQQKYCISKV